MNRAYFDFSGETVLVSGGTRGIGAAIAVAFADAGADVTVFGIGSPPERVSSELSARAANARHLISAIECDVTDSGSVSATFSKLGAIDVFINNAGVEMYTPLSDDSATFCSAAAKTAATNFTGALTTAQAVVPHMKPGGRIIFTASIWSKTAVDRFSAYCASKHATLGMTRSLARELGPAGIRVNAVCPGWVRTEASLESLSRIAESQARDEADVLAEITGAQCFGGLLEPQQLTGTYLFLASDQARDITGQSITVDRGETCI